MPYIVADRVAETSNTVGVGDFVMLGGAAGFRRFSAAMGVGDTCPYFIEALDANNLPSGEYEYGRGTYSAVDTLTRTTVLGSSNGGAAVNFSAGTKLVSVGVLAADMLAKGDTAALTPFALTLLDDANAGAARATLGSGAAGDSLFVAATAAAARTILGAGATGDALFTAATAAEARTTLGLAPGAAFGAYRNTTQSIANATYTKVQLNTEEFDTAGVFDSVANYRFQPPAGYYQINGQVLFAPSASGVGIAALFKNGSMCKRGTLGKLDSSDGIGCSVSATLLLNGADYIELFTYQNSGAALNLVFNNAGAENRLDGALVRLS